MTKITYGGRRVMIHSFLMQPATRVHRLALASIVLVLSEALIVLVIDV